MGIVAMRSFLALLLVGTSLAWQCPSWMAGICSPFCMVAHCMTPMKACVQDKDTGCFSNLKNTLSCMTSHKNATDGGASCMVPDNVLRDEFFNCAIEQHHCLNVTAGQKPPVYPKCRDTAVPGDKNFSLEHLTGSPWYKLQGWKLGEPVECFPCQIAQFTTKGAGVSFESNWTEPDADGKMWGMDVTATMTPDTERGVGKFFNTGEMLGLTYWEPYTVVKDGSQEAEPFIFFYVCGGTMAGNYTTAFALGKSPTLTPTLQARLGVVAESVGLHSKDFCTVDNTCFKNTSGSKGP